MAKGLNKRRPFSVITNLHEDILPGESTAQAIVRYFEARGTHRDKVRYQDLQAFYSAMNPTKAATYLSGEKALRLPKRSKASNDPVGAIIVETRKHPLLESIVSEFEKKLNISIQIFHGLRNKQFITESAIGQLIENNKVHLTDLGINELSQRDYNHLLLNPSFWKALLVRRKVLIFQTDSVLCENSPYRLEDFMQFDYVGSKWNRNRPVGIIADGGSGGFSLRDWELTMECLDRFPAKFWRGGEDGYYAFHLDLIGGNLARAEDCAKFSTQMEFTQRSFGAHQIRHLGESSLRQFLKYCPKATSILN